MHTALLIVAYNSPPQDIDRLIDSFGDLGRPASGLEVVVVQNDIGSKYSRPNVHTIYGHGNVGFAAGIKLALDNSTASQIVIANPDCYMEDGGAKSLVDYLSTVEQPAIVAPLIRDAQLGIAYHSYGDWTFTPGRYISRFWSKIVIDRLESSILPRGLKLPGTVLAMTRPVAQRFGPFDTVFFLYGEDRDMCRRARKESVNILLCRESSSIHEGGVSAKSVPTVVIAGQAFAALEIARRKYGKIGLYASALDLILTSRNAEIRRIRYTEISKIDFRSQRWT